MDLPATQAICEDEFPATQQFETNEVVERTLVGTLLINKTTHSIFSGITKIGRHPECQIVLNGQTVSKRHAEIEAESPNKTVFIRDLNSSNKTRINRGFLRPNAAYQIRDGDELIFGNIIAIFKVFQPINDSLVSCTPQVNRKLKAIIPSTPDSSMNTSSESDLSIIPGTQTDKTDSNFRHPEIPIRSSKTNEHKSPRVPAFTLDDLPSPLPKEKCRQDDICEAETQRFSTTDTLKHDTDDSIYNAATQKPSSISKPIDPDDNIYEMATQRPIDFNKEVDVLENLIAQQSNRNFPDSSKVINNQSVSDLETQPFNAETLNSDKQKSFDISIYSAATQKSIPDSSGNKCIDDLETQQFNLIDTNNDTSKSNDISIYSAATQKNECIELNNKPIEDLDTQQFNIGKLNISNRKSNDVSIYSAPTQKTVYYEPVESIENLETQVLDVQKDMSESKSLDVSIYSVATQKVNYDAAQASLENIEIQQIDVNQLNNFRAPSALQSKSNESLNDIETQKYVPEKSLPKSIEDMETQQFTIDITTSKFQTPNTKNEVSKISIHEIETQKFSSSERNNESIADVETQHFLHETSNKIVDESTESMHLIDESEKLTSSLSFTNPDMKTSCSKLKNGLDRNVSCTDIKDNKESSFDSGIQKTEQECNRNNTSEDENTSNLQCSKSLQSSFKQDNEYSIVNNDEDNTSKTVENIEAAKDILEGEDEEEMFSQNLIIDCPFAFLPEELTTDENESSKISKSEEKSDIKSNKITNDNIFNASTSDENNKHKKTENKIHNIINESDSETDEEGIFTNHSSNEEKSVQPNSKSDLEIKKVVLHKEADSETDEEGEFSNHLSNQSKNDTKNNRKNDNKNSISDSETNEEGVFLHRINKDKNKSLSNKNDNADSDEDIFENIPEVNEETLFNKSNISSSKNNCLIRQKSPTPDSQDLMFNDNCEVKRNSLRKLQTINNIRSSEDSKINKIEVDDLAPTKVINTCTSNTDNFIESMQVIHKEKESMQKIDENMDNLDLAPTQKVLDTQPCTGSQFSAQISNRQSNDCWNTRNSIELAPTQKIADTQLSSESQFVIPRDKHSKNYSIVEEKLDLALTHVIADTQPCTESQYKATNDKRLDNIINTEKILDLEPTQLISESGPCTEIRSVRNVIDEKTNEQNNLISRNDKIEDLEFNSVQTHLISSSKNKISLNQSKQIEELDNTKSKKVKATNDSQIVKLDINNDLKQNLNEMFEESENECAEVNQSTLLTQQLANILESSQNNDSLVTDLNESKLSPTLSSGRISKTKNRRRTLLLGKPDSLSSLVKPVINLNDTIERNLNEIFDDNVNNMETYEPDELMTQQLRNILQSQDDHLTSNDEIIKITKSPILCKTYEKKRHRLSLSVNLNSSTPFKKQKEQHKPKSSRVQSSSKNISESQETDEYFANLKSTKKCNVIDSQSDEEPMNIRSYTDNDIEIVYKRGMVGFSTTMKPVSTKKPVAFLEPKGRSYTSDSQSDGDEFSSIRSHKKRFSLSLSKHVNLNSSLSSPSDQEVGKIFPTESSTSSLKKTGNKRPSNTLHHAKRVFARGTRGFTSKLMPVESEELVSAASTESDEELRSIAANSKKVCTSKLYRKVTVNLTKLSPMTIAMKKSKTPISEKISDSDSDDSEFLRSMPPIKVVGTEDCPPMNSQLAAPSDSEDDDISLKVPSPVDIVIPTKWNWYLQKRYDLIYKKDAPKSPKTMPQINEDEKCRRSHTLENVNDKVLSVDDVLAEIDANQPIGKKRMMITPKQRRTRRRSNHGQDEGNDENIVKTRSARLLNIFEKQANSTPPNSPQLDIEVVNGNENNSFNKARSAEQSDSESESNIIPKFTPLPRFKLDMNYVDDSDSDQDFEEMRRNCERLLARPKTYVPQVRNTRRGRIPTMKWTREKTSPVITRRRRQSALSICNLTNVTHADSDRKTETSSKAGTVDQSAFVFQEAVDSFTVAEATKTTQSRMPNLTTIRTKRSGASDVEDAQNRPPKRSKSATVDEERLKLQQLSPVPVTTTDLDNKKVNKVSKTFDSLVVRHSSRNKTDSSNASVIENSVVEETLNEKNNGSQTRSRAVAVKRKKTKHEAPSLHNQNSSKENLVLENSEVENVPNTSNTRNTRLKKNQITDSSVIKNSSNDEIANSSIENYDKIKTRGRVERQKTDLPVKKPVEGKNIATTIQDSDVEESDESKFVKIRSKNRLFNTVQSLDSEKSNNSKDIKTESQNEKEKPISGKSNKLDINFISRSAKNKRIQQIKESDSEEIDTSTNVVDKRVSTRTRRGMKIENSNLENSSGSDNATTKTSTLGQTKNATESDTENSEAGNSKTSRNEGIKKSKAVQVESNIKVSHKSKLILNYNSEKPTKVVKSSRSRQAKDTEKINTTVNKRTTNNRANIGDQSSDSIFSESDTEKNKNLSLTNQSNRSRPIRQTRKRKVSTNISTVEASSSEESQEIAEIMKNSSEENENKSQKRQTRRAKDTLNSSEDTQDSESNNIHIDNIFEKPVSRPKRARLVKSARNKSWTQDNLPSDEETKTRSLQRSFMSEKKISSPEQPSTPSRSTPSRNKRTMSMSPMKVTSYKVLFTGERSEVHRKIVAKLGGLEMEDPQKCSILVTDKVRRTYKFLCCLAQGIPIVSVDWLNDSGKARRFLNWEDYILQDPIAEAKFNFKLKESLEKAVNHRLLEGYTVLLTPRITQPPITELKGMVISSGGKSLVKPPTKWPENTVIITREEDIQNAKKLIAKAPKSVSVHSTEFILTGILRQELSLEEFKLTV